MTDHFISVRKAGQSSSRGLIAVDAICAVFENPQKRCTEIMTMDGFWYEVQETISDIHSQIRDKKCGGILPPSNSSNTPTRAKNPKMEFSRRKRYTPPSVDEKMSSPKEERKF